MPIDFDPMLRNDLEKFLARYHLERIGDIPLPEIAEMDFPETDQKKEHLALSALVARLLRLERLLAKHTNSLDSLNEQDLVRGAVNPDFAAWRNGIARPALARLALLDCRERLGRLAHLAGEAKTCHAIERLSVLRDGEQFRDLGTMAALVTWLRNEVVDIRELTAQIPDMPVELLPQPAWRLFIDLRHQQDQLDTAAAYEPRNEEPEYLEAYLAKHHTLDEALGSLESDSDIFDAFDPDFAAFGSSTAAKYRPVRKILERGVARLDINRECLEDGFIGSSERIQMAIDEAYRLTSADNALWEFVGTEIFRPEDWKANREALAPLLLKSPQRISGVLRGYLSELVHAFVLGHWASVQALSRALLEQAIKLNCKSLEIDLYFHFNSRKKRKSLDTLIDELTEHFPSIKVDMNNVQYFGNCILHADPLRTGSDQEQATRKLKMRADAIRSLQSLYSVLEALPKLAR